jgi:hypothetical protein
MTNLRPACLRLLVLLALFFSAPALHAHETTRSYVSLTRAEGVTDAEVRIAFRDIEVAVWMDENLDGNITWGEAKQRLDAVSAYFASVFTLDAGGPCQLARKGASVSTDTGIDYLDLDFTVDCPDPKAAIRSVSHLFADIDPDHRMFLTANLDGATTTTLLSAASPDTLLNAESAGLLRSFVNYFEAGIEHLIGGSDHLVFLLVIMLPAVSSGMGRRAAIWNVITVLTGFTLAHALSLTAAATQFLRPNSVVIEILIALSIVITAIDNIRPFIPAPRAAVAAFFGIIHGFGFASALGVLNLAGSSLIVALVGFNLGIEIAQIVLVLIVLPLLFLVAHNKLVLFGASVAAGLIGCYWVVERIAL